MNFSPKPLRVLQIGCGGITGAWLPPAPANPDIGFVGLCDLSAQSVVKLRDRYDLPATTPIFGAAATALQKLKPGASSNCTTPGAHQNAFVAFAGLPSGLNSRWRIIGERGAILWDGAEGFACEIEDGKGFLRAVKTLEIPLGEFGTKASSHGGMLRGFIDSIRGGDAPETNAADNYYSLEMVLGAVEILETDARKVVGISSDFSTILVTKRLALAP